jgi:hypothetical protein
MSLSRSLACIRDLQTEHALTELKQIAKNPKTPLEIGLRAAEALWEAGAKEQLEGVKNSGHTPKPVAKAAEKLLGTVRA